MPVNAHTADTENTEDTGPVQPLFGVRQRVVALKGSDPSPLSKNGIFRDRRLPLNAVALTQLLVEALVRLAVT